MAAPALHSDFEFVEKMRPKEMCVVNCCITGANGNILEIGQAQRCWNHTKERTENMRVVHVNTNKDAILFREAVVQTYASGILAHLRNPNRRIVIHQRIGRTAGTQRELSNDWGKGWRRDKYLLAQ